MEFSGEHYLECTVLTYSAACSNLKVESETYTSSDALLSTDKALIIELEVNCDEASECSPDSLGYVHFEGCLVFRVHKLGTEMDFRLANVQVHCLIYHGTCKCTELFNVGSLCMLCLVDSDCQTTSKEGMHACV